MANVNDYLRKMGAQKISKKAPFSEADQLILARISYLPFHKIRLTSFETIASVAEKMKKLPASAFGWPDDRKLIELLGQSKRFERMRVSDFVRHNDKNLEKQFSAITIHLNIERAYLSFYGTDSSLTGWKEDFNLAFLDQIPAQIEALEYLKQIRRKFFWKKLYLGGHSKGGHVAIFAAIHVSDHTQKKIQAVYNYDGPGIRKDLAAQDLGSFQILGRIHTFVPQESIIGRLFEHREGLTIIHSTAKNVYQHDIYSWQVEGNKLLRSKTTKRSDMINRAINKWMQDASREEIKIFVNGMFEIFSSVELNNPIELMREWKHFAPKILKEFMNTPKEKKKIISEIWRKLGESLIRSQIEQNELLIKFNKAFKTKEK